MDANNISDEQLLDYLDGSLEMKQSKELEALIEKSPTLAQRFAELKKVDAMLSGANLKSPSRQFAFDVMKSIGTAPEGIRKGGLLMAIAAIITVLLGAYFTVGDMINLSILPQTDYLPSITQYLPKSVDLKAINSILLLVLSIFSLLIFDKTVLKPLFKKRKYHY